MAIRKTTVSAATRRDREQPAKFESTAEWKTLKAAIDKGFAEPGDDDQVEVWEVALSPEDQERYDIHHRRAVSRFLQKYLRENGKDYRVKSFDRGGTLYYQVIGKTQGKRKSRKTA